MCDIWGVLNRIAIIVTILGFPTVVVGMYEIIYKGIVKYDAYKEQNNALGDTLKMGDFTQNDYRKGKKQNSKRLYHVKGYEIDDQNSWK